MYEVVTIQAILYVAHGSRSDTGVREAKNFIQHHIDKINVPIQIISFIDLASPTINEGIRQCVLQGATKIAVIPILLLEAGHSKQDLPAAIKRGKQEFPDVTITYDTPFGVQEAIVDVLIKRMKEQKEIIKQSHILIVARGSSDDSIRDDFKKIVELLNSKVNVSQINVCYLAAQTPTFEQGLKTEIKRDAKRNFIVPYLLFTGLLMKHIERKIEENNLSHEQFILCDHIGLDEKISDLLINRVYKLINDTSLINMN